MTLSEARQEIRDELELLSDDYEDVYEKWTALSPDARTRVVVDVMSGDMSASVAVMLALGI